MSTTLSPEGLDLMFRAARTHNAWLVEPVSDETLRQLYALMKWGPTSTNCCPARVLFLRTPEAKQRLLPALAPGNVEKTKSAPVTAIIGYDGQFYEQLPKLFPHADARAWFVNAPDLAGGHGAAQQCAAGRLPDARRTSTGARLRPDVRLRFSQGRPGLLP